MFKRRFNLCLILATALAAIIIPQIAMSQEYLVDKVIALTAPTGGVVKDSPYVIQNFFVVAAETKAEGQPFAAMYKNVVVSLPYYQGTIYHGQPAHWYTATNKTTDYEGREIGFFVEDCGPTDTTCDVLLTGRIFDPLFRSCTPLVDGLPQEILVTMVGGSGTGAFSIDEYADSFEVSMTTNGNWNNLGTITLTVTKPGVVPSEVWTAQAQGLPPRVAREIRVVAGTNQLLIYSTNTSGIPVSAGSRITNGLVWRVAKREP